MTAAAPDQLQHSQRWVLLCSWQLLTYVTAQHTMCGATKDPSQVKVDLGPHNTTVQPTVANKHSTPQHAMPALCGTAVSFKQDDDQTTRLAMLEATTTPHNCPARHQSALPTQQQQ
jgi:hypothetical protein